MTTRRGLFGLIAGLAAAPVAAKLAPVDVATTGTGIRFLEANVSYACKPGRLVGLTAAELPSHTHHLTAFEGDLREYIRMGLYDPHEREIDDIKEFYEGSQWPS